MTTNQQNRRNLDQLRAEDALRCVRTLPQRDGVRALYRSYVERFGPTVVMNGLGQALATELAAAGRADRKDNPQAVAHCQLYQNVQSWLCRDGGVYPAGKDLLDALMEQDESHYVRAQAETLAWLTWHKKFCQALLPKADRAEEDDT